MIKSYKDKQTEVIANGLAARKLPQDMQRAALRKLRQLGAAKVLMTCGYRQEIGWKRCTRIVRGSTAFASTINGGSASAGSMVMHTTLK
ncbi:hypothetical protein GCM10027398_00870 [Azotobacter salinestris]